MRNLETKPNLELDLDVKLDLDSTNDLMMLGTDVVDTQDEV